MSDLDGIVTAWDPISGTGIVKSDVHASGCLFGRTAIRGGRDPHVGQHAHYRVENIETVTTVVHIQLVD